MKEKKRKLSRIKGEVIAYLSQVSIKMKRGLFLFAFVSLLLSSCQRGNYGNKKAPYKKIPCPTKDC